MQMGHIIRRVSVLFLIACLALFFGFSTQNLEGPALQSNSLPTLYLSNRSGPAVEVTPWSGAKSVGTRCGTSTSGVLTSPPPLPWTMEIQVKGKAPIHEIVPVRTYAITVRVAHRQVTSSFGLHDYDGGIGIQSWDRGALCPRLAHGVHYHLYNLPGEMLLYNSTGRAIRVQPWAGGRTAILGRAQTCSIPTSWAPSFPWTLRASGGASSQTRIVQFRSRPVYVVVRILNRTMRIRPFSPPLDAPGGPAPTQRECRS